LEFDLPDTSSQCWSSLRRSGRTGTSSSLTKEFTITEEVEEEEVEEEELDHQ
jgi:hypothetical protein